LIFFPRVVAGGFGEIVGLDRLRVDNQSAWLWIAAFLHPNLAPQSIMEALPDSFRFPSPEQAVNRLPIGEIVGQIAPLTSGAKTVKDGVYHLAFGMHGGSSPLGCAKLL
jgi:hypothetical protein